MKTTAWVLAIGFLVVAAPVFAETNVTIQDDGAVAVRGGQPAGVVVQQAPRAYTTERIIVGSDTDVDIAGRIVSVDHPNSTIVVRDERPRDRRITGDPGIVSTLKVGDYVEVKLRNNSETEAFRIIEK